MAKANLFQPGPKFKFPKRTFGGIRKFCRSCQVAWFKEFPFLHYKASEDAIYCYVCTKAVSEKQMFASRKHEATFTTKGFCNWKDAKAAFKKHKTSAHHCEAVEATITQPKNTQDIGELLDNGHASQIAEGTTDHSV